MRIIKVLFGLAVAVLDAAASPPITQPEFFGVYLLADGRQVELEEFSFRVPDAIKKANRVASNSSRPEFIIFGPESKNAEKFFLVEMTFIARFAQLASIRGVEYVSCRTIDEIMAGPGEALRLKAGPIGPDMVKIIPAEDMKPGWYMLTKADPRFITINSGSFFMFGVNVASDDPSFIKERWTKDLNSIPLQKDGTAFRVPQIHRYASNWNCQ